MLGNNWLADTAAAAALSALDAHYAALGCRTRSRRLEDFLDDIAPHQTKEATKTLRSAFAALADGERSPLTIRELAQGTWLTFLEPAQGLAEIVDRYGVGGAVGRRGAYGRQWARYASDAAWTIWIVSGGYSSHGSGIAR
ncbi:hypothetical protein [Streptomyces sp. RP5T]|uniref:hypothetical protein n=1 Tax=Streptomyces sp. RP5T TaxID=2490848 RepID=UPI000F655E31|nr:hypothetical protein [Streptomyces sp. RP5T]RRR79264.1 hypothetical protein EHS43_24415 [Streptomyces sp. RP5T]